MPICFSESSGISGPQLVTLFDVLPAIAILRFVARDCIADRQHRLVLLITGRLIGVGFWLFGLGLLVASVNKTTVLFYLTRVWVTLLTHAALSKRVGLER